MELAVEANLGRFAPRWACYDVVMPGCGLHAYHWIGHALALRVLERRGAMRVRRIYGGSSGAVLAVLYACGVGFDEWRTHYDETRRRLAAGEWLADIYRDVLTRVLPDDAHEQCAGRVLVALTELGAFVPRHAMVTTFATRDELLDCVYAATLIPFVTAAKPSAALRGKWYCDAMVMPTLTSDVPLVMLVPRDSSIFRRLVPAANLEVDVAGGAEELMRMLV
jgi:hypothetical protein